MLMFTLEINEITFVNTQLIYKCCYKYTDFRKVNIRGIKFAY